MKKEIDGLIIHELINDALNDYCRSEYGCDANEMKGPQAEKEIRYLKSIFFNLIKRYEDYFESSK